MGDILTFRAKAAGDACNSGRAAPEPIYLKSVRLIGRILYVNNDPGMPYQMPYQWTTKELVREIERACIDYGVIATTQRASLLAQSIAKSLINESFNGGFELGWD